MSSKRPTMADVAKRAGVSSAAVSYALNGQPGVSDATRERVRQAAEELGWVANRAARALVSQRYSVVALVMRRTPDTLALEPFFAPLLAGIEGVLSQADLSLAVRVVGDDEENVYRTLAQSGVAGFVLTDLRETDVRPALVKELGTVAVALGLPDQAPGLPTVHLDDRVAICQAVHHLVGLGHSRIAHVTGVPGMVRTRSRIDAVTTAMAEAGLGSPSLERGDFTAQGGFDATKRLFTATAPPPTAIVYASDVMAIAGMSALADLGVQVPDDVSVTGYDNVPLSPYTSPPLTTVDYDVVGWGRHVAQALLTALDDPSPTHTCLPPGQLVLRASTALVAPSDRPPGRPRTADT